MALHQAGTLVAGKLALVTGSASGIGRAVCKILAREGARVAAVDIDSKGSEETVNLLQAHSTKEHHSFQADVSSFTEVNNLLKQVKDTYAGHAPTIAVHCAGITSDNFLLKMDEKDFDKVININLKGTFFVTQAVARNIIEQQLPEGSIVNIASVVGKSGNLGQSNYAASKGGVVSFTKTAAKELAQFNIRCNSVMPGYIETPIMDTVPKKVIDMIISQIPMRRGGKPEEVAEACLFLASPLSNYITGTSIEVTGGLFM